MIVRMAVSMGYHFDGEQLGLSPFETEIRRRVWWQLVVQDANLTISNGFKHHNLGPRQFTTKLPLNLNDADLYPGATEPYASREGPTEMGFLLVFNRIMVFFVDEHSRVTTEAAIFKAAGSETDISPKDLEKLRKTVMELDADLLEIERRFINPEVGNHHRAVGSIRPIVLDRLHEILAPSHRQPGPGNKDKLFRILVLNSENITAANEHMFVWGYWWLMELHFHTEILAALTSQLCQRPLGSLSDRGWNALEKIYAQTPSLLDLSKYENVVQAQFAIKAFGVREKAAMDVGQITDTPSFIADLRQRIADLAQEQEQQQANANAWVSRAGDIDENPVSGWDLGL